ncbi:hypothetical protein THRCLA_01740 [Thraustotheca clavata]|uniref:Uncharacterized protein n=1 Tax=Thraustotheca clavata TaxID=74557 RepID=A0A1W0A7F3_9STRA|nr:hypothetical protein THRCLA_01740 [Thraustotheca clavata]
MRLIGKKRKAAVSVDEEIKTVNAQLQSDTTARESWQIGKRLKGMIDANPNMTNEQMGNTLCMWGTAISRIATENDDVTLAEAAVDKFEQALQLLGKEEMGPYGMALYGSTSMIVATEKEDRTVLEAALKQFQMAVDMDTPEAFESHFQYAKALKEGSHLVQHLIESGADKDLNSEMQSPKQLLEKALSICEHLLVHHADVLNHPKTSSDDVLVPEINKDNSEEEEDEVTTEDMSEVILLQAQILVHLATKDPLAIFNTFKRSYELFSENLNALIEMNAYLIQIKKSDAMSWIPHLEYVEKEFKSVLLSIEFDTDKCNHVIRFCMEDELDAFDERAPKLLDCMGRNLLEQLKCHKEKNPELAAKTILILRTAHHLHDKFGCYPLATLYALPLYFDPKECNIWMETCESYGVLDEEFKADEFKSMEELEWYKQYVAGGKLNATEATVVE